MSTIKDVAEAANVSIGTVSKYINGIHIREKNRIAIERAIAALDYRINPTAQALKTNRTRNVVVTLPSITSAYSPQIISIIESELSSAGYTVMIMDTHGDRALERKKIEEMLNRRADGFIVFPIDHESENVQRILECGVPVCVVDAHLENLQCAQVVSDNAGATFQATMKLLGEGHRRIGVITGSEFSVTATERLEGYLNALRKNGIQADESLIARTPDFSENQGYRAAQQLLNRENPPTALIACNYYTTLGAVCALMDRGIDFAREVRVIGFDYEKLPRIARRPMGIIMQDIQRIAKTTAQCLLKQMRGEENSALIRVPTQYIEWTMDRITNRA